MRFLSQKTYSVSTTKIRRLILFRDVIGVYRATVAHFPDNRLTDGGEVVSLSRRPRFTAIKII
jgi:hypothetical protein